MEVILAKCGHHQPQRTTFSSYIKNKQWEFTNKEKSLQYKRNCYARNKGKWARWQAAKSHRHRYKGTLDTYYDLTAPQRTAVADST